MPRRPFLDICMSQSKLDLNHILSLYNLQPRPSYLTDTVSNMRCCRPYSALHLVLCLILTPYLCLSSTSSASPTLQAIPSGTPAATGSASFGIPGPYNITSQWAASLSVFEAHSLVTTGLSLSLPFDTGPSTASANGTYWDACVLWLSDLVPKTFTGVDPSAAGAATALHYSALNATPI